MGCCNCSYDMEGLVYLTGGVLVHIKSNDFLAKLKNFNSLVVCKFLAMMLKVVMLARLAEDNL